MKNASMDGKIARWMTLLLTAFVGLGAVSGATAMFRDPLNPMQMGPMLVCFQKMPLADVLFQDFIFSGISLLIVNGLSNLTAFVLLILKKRAGYVLGWLFGITLMLWICIQFWLFAPEVYAIDVVFFLLGLAQFAFGYLADTRDRQARFAAAHPAIKPQTESGAREAVVYFSRMGYTRTLAEEKASALHCDLIALRPKERTRGNLGFWWCGRFGMHRWAMPVEPVQVDLAAYDCIHIYSPVWVFSIAAPLRAFLRENGAQLKQVNLTIVHFMHGPCRFVFPEVRRLLGERLREEHSVCCRRGRMKTCA